LQDKIKSPTLSIVSIIEVIILALVEGITEFLPVSSTGHMIIASSLMGIEQDPFVKLFEVCIQLGAILAVVVLYFRRFLKSLNFYLVLFCGFLPTAVLGLLLKKRIDLLLENVEVVAFSLLFGGIILVFIDRLFSSDETDDLTEVSWKTAFWIGVIQSVSMIPGVSRSAATIIGGLTQKLTRKTAAEFSFFLAVPTMFAATAKSMWDEKELLMASTDKIWLLLLGNGIAFVVAYLVMSAFVGFLNRNGFRLFGYYRILLGLTLLGLLYSGVPLKIID
jgi:undecaprenyl-diphosphatase